MIENYIGVTIRKEVLAKDGLAINLKTLKSIAIEAMHYYYKPFKMLCPDIVFEKLLPSNIMIQEYNVKPTTGLRIKLSLDTENYAPFNCWMEVNCLNSREWGLLSNLARYLSTKFPTLTFNLDSSFFLNPHCTGSEKYTNLFKNGVRIQRLTRQQWAKTYLNTN